MKRKSILAWALVVLGLSLGACSKDEPTQQGGRQTPQTEDVENLPTEAVSIELEMDEQAEDEARALNYDATFDYDADDHLKVSSNQPDELPATLILRHKSAGVMIYKPITWKRTNYNGTYVWTYRTKDLQLPANLSKYQWWAMVVLGGTLTGSGNDRQLTIASHSSTIVDLAQNPTASLEVPYASNWRFLKWNNQTKSYRVIDAHSNGVQTNKKFKLFPLGIVMTYRVQNNMNNASGVEGLRVMTNHLEGRGSFDLSRGALPKLPQTTDVPQSETAPALEWTKAADLANGKDANVLYGKDADFYQYNYAINTGMISRGDKSDKIVVAWYQPNNKPTRVDFTDANSALGAYALTHVYAVGAKNASGAITKPNYEVVPIMGSDVQLTSGKKYEMPCELYEQPNMQLGYFAQTLVRNQGNINDRNMNVTTPGLRLLNRAEQYDPRYVAHLNNSKASELFEAIRGDLQVPLKSDVVWGLGLVAGHKFDFTDPNDWAPGTKQRPQREYFTTVNANPVITADGTDNRWMVSKFGTMNGTPTRDEERDFVALNSNGGVAVGSSAVQNVAVLFRSPKVGVRKTDRQDALFNLYQSAYRLTKVKYTNSSVPSITTIWDAQKQALGTSNGYRNPGFHGNPWAGNPFGINDGANADKYVYLYLQIESIYLGKYYLGDVEVVRNSEKLFESRSANKVERHLPMAGELIRYPGESLEFPYTPPTANWQETVRNIGCKVSPLVQGVEDHYEPGTLSRNGGRYHDHLAKGLFFYSHMTMRVIAGSSFGAFLSNRPVLPISTTYKGDNARPTN